ncbi:tetratricopeptide repeat protein [Acidobacteriota bacterium]
MKKTLIINIMAVLIVVAFCTSSVYSQFALVQGSVKSENGKPIKDAKVVLVYAEDGNTVELLTDKKGKWMKANIRAGQWTIGFAAEGYLPKTINVQFSAAKRNPSIDIRLSPSSAIPKSKADELFEQGKYDEALQEYQKMLAENPDLYKMYDKIGQCYYKLENFDKAVESFKLMLDKEPESQDALLNLSAVYFEKGNLEEGMNYFNQLNEQSRSNAGLLYNVGSLLFKNGQADLAIEYLKKSIEINPNFVDAYYQLALSSLNKGDTEEAKKNFEKVIEMAPDSEKAAIAKNILESIS